MKREPAVAGSFYTADPDRLESEIHSLTQYTGEPVPASACVVPHAGYVYSGRTCGKVLSRIRIPDTAIILSPNHTGMGTDFSVWNGEEWATPLGDIPVDTELRDAVCGIRNAAPDTLAHMHEHSIEVILPFLKVLRPDISIVPVTVRNHDPDLLVEFGKELFRIISSADNDVLLIASSDMTHQEPAEQARAKDEPCIEKMTAVDPEGLFEQVTSNHVTMCGVSPVTVLLSYCREKGITEGTLVEYTNSGAAFGDYSRVVGYAGLTF
jgi:AmmeMemoRadiSam system protein B